MVRSGSRGSKAASRLCVTGTRAGAFSSPRLAAGTMNGSGVSKTNLRMPCAMRRMVASASGRSRPKIDRPAIDQSMQSATGRHRFWPPRGFFACVCSGQTIGWPSRRQTM